MGFAEQGVEELRRELQQLKEAFAQYREVAEPALLGLSGAELATYVAPLLRAVLVPFCATTLSKQVGRRPAHLVELTHAHPPLATLT
jgi:hypothetical protein